MHVESGITREYIDPSVRPQDDLFRHVNGKWLESAQIPEDRARDGEFMRLNDEAEANVRAIIETLAGQQWDPATDEFKIAELRVGQVAQVGGLLVEVAIGFRARLCAQGGLGGKRVRPGRLVEVAVNAE